MAVSKVEMALQASVAVRDKVVSAYQDIMRMTV
jgi:flagellar hook-basal body complex protein FliE